MRLEIGDTTSTDALFTDEEINYKLGENADAVLITAAELCDILATRFAREYDFETDDQKFLRSQKAAAYAARATELRKRANGGGGVESGTTTRVDGYSDDITSRDTSGVTSTSGRVRRGWTNPDLPY